MQGRCAALRFASEVPDSAKLFWCPLVLTSSTTRESVMQILSALGKARIPVQDVMHTGSREGVET